MAKLSRKKRKLLNNNKQKTIKTGIPYSHKNIRICRHYSCDMGTNYYSKIINYKEIYKCIECCHIFTKNEYDSMNNFINYCNNTPNYKRDNNFEKSLLPDPIKYYYSAQDEISEIETERNDNFPNYNNKYLEDDKKYRPISIDILEDMHNRL